MEHQTIYSKLRVWDKRILLCHSKINFNTIELSNVRWSFFYVYGMPILYCISKQEKKTFMMIQIYFGEKKVLNTLLEFFQKFS